MAACTAGISRSGLPVPTTTVACATVLVASAMMPVIAATANLRIGISGLLIHSLFRSFRCNRQRGRQQLSRRARNELAWDSMPRRPRETVLSAVGFIFQTGLEKTSQQRL